MNNNPMDELYKEHTVISKTEKLITEMNNLWMTDPETFKMKVEKMLHFFREYADNIHHKKEEQYLFPALTDNDQFTLHEMLSEFENHHEEFRNYLQNIEEAVSKQNWESAYKLLKSYSLDLRDHIAAENEELFVLAENLLSPSELETLYFRFKDIDLETGENKIKELESMLNN
ncbi:MAG: hemerythrin domain-containing protein [Crocinitomicaceae bacterium]|nr:hemerythrin domain-containing protein [Crocinitomicaceae bacterium]